MYKKRLCATFVFQNACYSIAMSHERNFVEYWSYNLIKQDVAKLPLFPIGYFWSRALLQFCSRYYNTVHIYMLVFKISCTQLYLQRFPMATDWIYIYVFANYMLMVSPYWHGYFIFETDSYQVVVRNIVLALRNVGLYLFFLSICLPKARATKLFIDSDLHCMNRTRVKQKVTVVYYIYQTLAS